MFVLKYHECVSRYLGRWAQLAASEKHLSLLLLELPIKVDFPFYKTSNTSEGNHDNANRSWGHAYKVSKFYQACDNHVLLILVELL